LTGQVFVLLSPDRGTDRRNGQIAILRKTLENPTPVLKLRVRVAASNPGKPFIGCFNARPGSVVNCFT